MAGDPSNLLPYRWTPGQSGNPRGSSAKRRQARRLREGLDSILGDEVPDWLIARMPDELRADLPEGVTFAELIALRLVWVASTEAKSSLVLAAAQAIINAQRKPDELAPREAVRPPVLETSEERRAAVAEQLGVDLADDEEPPRNVH